MTKNNQSSRNFSSTTKSVKIVAKPTKVAMAASSYGPYNMAASTDEETGNMSDPTSNSNGSYQETMDDESEQLSRRYRSSISSSSTGFGDLHMLTSYRPGESKVERMARKIQTRIEEQTPVTFEARREFLKHCRKISENKKYDKISRVLYQDILDWHEQVEEEATERDAEGIWSRTIHAVGILSHKQCLHAILTKAKAVADKIGLEPDDDFHYMDFNHHHTVLVSRWPWMRHELLFAMALVLAFYISTPILFCVIMGDEGVCQQDAKVPGWVSSLYFASATMSTVGYGDLSVSRDANWKVLVGVCYMLAAILVAIMAFSAAAETATSPLKGILKRISPVYYPEGPLKDNEYSYQRIRKLKLIMLADICIQFWFLNIIGILASQAFIAYTEVDEDRMWNWVDSLYWAVQTTTTIGYGDYSMPEYMRPMNVFYLSLSSYFTGNVLGRLGNLKNDIENVRRQHAFERREVNKNMIHYFASTNDQSKVDQYEFVIASLLNLRKVKYEDIAPIMDKFRVLARHGGHSGYIHVADMPEETILNMNELEEVEGCEGA